MFVCLFVKNNIHISYYTIFSGCIVEVFGIEQHRKKIGNSAAHEVSNKEFLHLKLRLGREGVSKDTNKYYKLAAGEHTW
jgi:hypothetical protein